MLFSTNSVNFEKENKLKKIISLVQEHPKETLVICVYGNSGGLGTSLCDYVSIICLIENPYEFRITLHT